MAHLSQQEALLEQEILYKLTSPGLAQRKGETQLFQQYAYMMRTGVHKYALPADDLFDSYSDTMLAVMAAITGGSFQGKSSLKTFVYKIFHHKCIDTWRKKKSSKNRVHQTVTHQGLSLPLQAQVQPVLEELIQKGEAAAIKQQLQQLGHKSQYLLQLFAAGYTDEEIALEMQFKTREVAKTSRLRCMKTLRQLKKAG
jgi:RNA polymerase sigma factor (sigma-70 family)